jgi:hypothetical protein
MKRKAGRPRGVKTGAFRTGGYGKGKMDKQEIVFKQLRGG